MTFTVTRNSTPEYVEQSLTWALRNIDNLHHRREIVSLLDAVEGWRIRDQIAAEVAELDARPRFSCDDDDADWWKDETPSEVRQRIDREMEAADAMQRDSLERRADAAWREDADLWRSAIHESGHATYLIANGFGVNHAVVRHVGRSFCAFGDIRKVPQDAQAEAGMAGPLAELEIGITDGSYCKPAPGEWRGDSDYEIVRDIMGTEGGWLKTEDKVIRQLAAHRPKLLAMALRLFETPNKEVSGAELKRVFDNAPFAGLDYDL